jgi:hypothetical protein
MTECSNAWRNVAFYQVFVNCYNLSQMIELGPVGLFGLDI